jgi:23S rRNA (cytosine1962-C5)-methyltransferase
MSTHLPMIRLRAREGRRVLSGAPWVFSNELQMDEAAKKLEPGSLVRLGDSGGAVIGTGYFNSKSLIGVRLLSRSEETIDRAFLEKRLRAAFNLRERLYDAPYYRLVHAEGDGLPGLIIDRFGDALSAQVNTAGMEKLTPLLLEAIDAVLKPVSVTLRNDAPTRTLEGLDLYVRDAKGEGRKHEVLENGVRYLAELSSGQKSGWYYDQRDNRAFAASFSGGRNVLDAYCYSGGFAIACAKAGAHVLAIDSSNPALSLAQEAATLNGVADRCRFESSDVFDAFTRLIEKKDTFDVVICDPPPFVRARKDLESGARAYRKLARQAAQLVSPSGILLLASCSHNMPRDRFALECAAGIAKAGRQASLIRESGAGCDHPIHPLLPETAYLKALTYALG